MGLIPQAKCSRCDRIYSGLRTRCPYCGARRRKKGKRTEDTDTAPWKMIIGGLLMLVLIAAVIVLLVNTFSAEEPADDVELPPEDEVVSDEGVDSIVGEDGADDEPIVEDPVVDEPIIPETIKAESIAIYYGEQEKTDVSIYYNEGENALSTSRELTQITGYYANAAALVIPKTAATAPPEPAAISSASVSIRLEMP